MDVSLLLNQWNIRECSTISELRTLSGRFASSLNPTVGPMVLDCRVENTTWSLKANADSWRGVWQMDAHSEGSV
jgi:hypothetical protein